ncbi:ABC transporter ATP-binding protein [Roseiarcaceae bacterium H3SJ34-1]|uniref:ATP-binding cassette domain-containing protein n=1 Tax=Terripilifer ovatus TaxID=3032367 RepID=UPI003AB96DFF|nr:ABC transporter ATP-binding protein [Roseiarcaceae bacterium H3SJ34-1]
MTQVQDSTRTERREGAETPLIQLDHISISFDGGRSRAVDDVSLAVARGTFVSLVGESGSGKTSLLKTINGLVIPFSGHVNIEGRPIPPADHDDDIAAFRRGIGYVIQDVGLFPHMSVAENIAVTPRLLRWPESRVIERVKSLIAMVGLPEDYATRAPAMLSGGQKQRVGVARALAAEPKIVLMDEPFGALDPLTRDTLGRAYRDLHERFGLTTIMVTHDMQEAALLSDRIVVMQAGRVICDDTPRALLTQAPRPEVSDLLNLPRRQAERIRAMIEPEADPR